jgi:uncharacterized protein involved in exopolysaccharide biosynthesis
MLEEEIDLRPYIEAIVKKWYWVIGSGIIAGIVAFLIASNLPDEYEATALVAIIEANNVIQFDTRFQDADETQPLNAFPELAKSDELLNLVLKTAELPRTISLSELAEQLSVEQGADKSLLRFIVTEESPEAAASLTNVWAKQFVDWANLIYRDQEDEVLFFEERLEVTKQNLDAVEQALIEFQSIDQSDTISNTLSVYNNTQKAYLQEEQELILLLQDAESLRGQLSNTNSQDNNFAYELTALSLQLRTFHAGNTLPIQLAFDNSLSLENLNRADQLAFLESLIAVIEDRSIQVKAELNNLTPQIQSLQQQFQEFDTEHERLSRDFQITEETYLALATKLEEERITSQSTFNNFRLVSQASIPSEPVNSRSLFNVIIAASLASSVAIMLILINKWWVKPD